ncbi:MAG: hypothetical protein R3C11_12140 [Planctomycetaceae bacterium]
MNILLVAAYFAWDSLKYKRENRAKVETVPENPEKFAIKGD